MCEIKLLSAQWRNGVSSLMPAMTMVNPSVSSQGGENKMKKNKVPI